MLVSIEYLARLQVWGVNVGRIDGVVGSAYSYAIMWLFESYPWILLVCITLFSIPCFYLMIYTNYPKVGQVSLVMVSGG